MISLGDYCTLTLILSTNFPFTQIVEDREYYMQHEDSPLWSGLLVIEISNVEWFVSNSSEPVHRIIEISNVR